MDPITTTNEGETVSLEVTFNSVYNSLSTASNDKDPYFRSSFSNKNDANASANASHDQILLPR